MFHRLVFLKRLCLLWKHGMQVVLISSSAGHIDVQVTWPNSFSALG